MNIVKNGGARSARPTLRNARSPAQNCFVLLFAVALVLCVTPAQAMHLPEGVLAANWAVAWFLASAPFVFWGLRTIQRRRAEDPRVMPLVALVGAAIFVISCMPVPIPLIKSCSHPCGTGLGALLIGPGPTIVVASIALLFQALFLSHGGLTTLGVNTFSMGVVGALSAYVVFRSLRSVRVPVFAAAVAAGLLSDWATYLTTSLALAAPMHGDGLMGVTFIAAVLGFVPTQVPLGIAEGILTAVAYRFVLQRRPELLAVPCRLPSIAGAKG
jgi:cobalt/nickel transport system permease protein